jgi:hypothetical protein
MTDIPTLANAAAPPVADPDEFGSPIERAAPKSTKPPETFEQRRHAQEQAAAVDKPPATPEPQQPAQGEKVKIGKYEVSEAELGAMMDRQAQEDLRAATRPANPEAYKAELPADLVLPGGQTYTFDPNDPSLVAARNLAHAKGWSQQDFSEALGIFATHIAGENAALAEASRAEIAKAGVNASMRVDAIGKWIRAEVGDADAKPILATIVTDAHLRFYEKMHQRITSQGSASFTQQHRVPPDTSEIPGYENMSFEQRRQAQDQRRAGR